MAVKQKSKGLGRGLGSLLNTDILSLTEGERVQELSINAISPNPEQPRRQFDEASLAELAASIKAHGVIQPLIVVRQNDGYMLVAGERRWRAARLAGQKTVPVIIRDLDHHQILQQALIENVQREDLNPLDEAAALDRLIQDFSMTQDALAQTIGKSRPAIANTLRLLRLSEPVQSYLREGRLSAGHARALLALEKPEDQKKLAERIIEEDLSVRAVERLIRKWLKTAKTERETAAEAGLSEAQRLGWQDMEDRLSRHLGSRVHLHERNHRGKIEIEYYSEEDRERLFDIILGKA